MGFDPTEAMRSLMFIYLLVLSTVVQTAYGQWVVCPDCSVPTIKEAVQLSSPLDTIQIKRGTYREHDINIDKPLILKGEPGAVIDAENKGYVILINADSVTVSGLTLRNVKISHTTDYAAILVHRSEYFKIENNSLENAFFGIMLEKSHHGQIKSNRVSGSGTMEFDSGNGIHLWHCSDITIEENELFELRDGIYLEFVDESTITRNVSHNNLRYGLHFMFSDHDIYSDNEFFRNGSGVAVMFSKYIKMYRNSFYDNWGTASYGLLLKEIYDAEIENNVFRENTVGINVDGSTRIEYRSNDFLRNGWAVRVTGGCYGNVFAGNNFLSNSFDLSYNSKMNDNVFKGNFWSNYTGYDLDRDGVGDVPYRPVKLFSYVVNRTPETIVLLRSLFIDLINFSEKVSPVFTPDDLLDVQPRIKPNKW